MKLRLLFSSFLMALGMAAFSQSVGLIGSAWSGGWDNDTNMVQHPDSAHLWSLDITLAKGEAKFRQDDAWTINWGADSYPTGIGTQGGPNIPIPGGGLFHVDFNSTTGAYNFLHTADIGILGDATPGGWDNDTDMYRDAADTNQYYITMNLGLGKCKFRQNNTWDVNWGGAFPSGTAVPGGSDISIPKAGEYVVKFNKSTLEYSFVENVAYTAISIIGPAYVDWSTDYDLAQDNANPDLWKGELNMKKDSSFKFRANHDWAINWGGGPFPAGTATKGGNDMKCDSTGLYAVEFTPKTGVYKFTYIPIYTSVSIIGDAAPGSPTTDNFLDPDPTNKSIWKKRYKMKNGTAKFRANGNWDVNWGAGDFPTGVGILDGPSIPVVAGDYKITFNSTTGDYNFDLVVVYDTIGMVGNAFAPPTSYDWDHDLFMKKDPTDEYKFTIASIDLIDAPIPAMGTDTGGVKFRANHAWAINWGAKAFPAGTGTQNGPNIKTVAGKYGVTFNTGTGEYAFGDPLSATHELLWADAVSLVPNPATDFVQIETSAAELTGDVRVTVFDNLGRRALEQEVSLVGKASINVSSLKSGVYALQISRGKYIVGKQLVVVR